MVELEDPPRDPELRERLEDLRRAISAALDEPALRPGDIPSCEETRELLGLYAKLPTEDLRNVVLSLLRVIVGPPA